MDSQDDEKDIPDHMKSKTTHTSAISNGETYREDTQGPPKSETAADAENIAADNKSGQQQDTAASGANQASPELDLAAAMEAIQRLSELSTLEYSLRRKAAAKEIGVSVTYLDKEVASLRRTASVHKAGGEIDIHPPEPWADPVELADVLDAFATEVTRHTILSNSAADAVALWIMHTYVHDAFMISPRLLLTSPDKRCGKSTLLGIIQQLAYKAVTTANATAPSIFRLIDEVKPTLLIDEADTFLEAMTEGRGIINSGHVKTSAYVIRNVGEDFKPKRFSTWAPMLIAQIGLPVGTLIDRSVVVELRRKKPSESVDKLDLTNGLYPELRSKAQRWAIDSQGSLASVSSIVPAGLNDRAADNWGPLAAIAEAAGRDWPARMADAARRLSNAEAASDTSSATMLLSDIKDAFDEAADVRIATEDLRTALIDLDNRPWSEWKHSKPISAQQIAQVLKPFGIHPKNVRIGSTQFKGYALADFTDAFERYLT